MKKTLRIRFWSIIALWISLSAIFISNAQGAEILRESWDQGVIDIDKWELAGSGVDTSLTDLGGGDYALSLSGSTYTNGIRSVVPVKRGDNARCSFMLWKDSGDWSWNSICGPWVNRNSLNGSYPTLEQVEAGLMRYNNTMVGVQWGEGITSWNGNEPLIESAFTSAWFAATEKARAVHVRVWLGDTTGSRCDWSTDGTIWNPLKLKNGTPVDTIGLPAGQSWNGVKVSNTDPVWIFFGGAYARSYVDDVLVQNDADVYIPPTPPPSPPKPSDVITSTVLRPLGEYYQATVPATLDLAERARLSVQGLTNFLNPVQSYAPYGQCYFNVKPPFMSQIHYAPGPPNWGKIALALQMTRRMCGSDYNEAIELAMVKGMVDDIYPKLNNSIPTPMSVAMTALIDLYKQSPTDGLRHLIAQMAQAHRTVVKNTSEGAYYWEPEPDYADSMLGVLGHGWTAFVNGRALQSMSVWYDLSGEASSLDLMGRLRGFLLDDRFWEPEGEPRAMTGSEHGHFMGHAHSFGAGLLGLLFMAQSTHDARLMEFVRGGYEYFRCFGLSRIGLYGEACMTGDMTTLAVKLSEMGIGDYWDDVDGYVRNHLTELQITDAAKLQAVTDQTAVSTRVLDSIQETADHVIERNVGAFLSDSSHPGLIPTDNSESTYDPLMWTICCTGNCTRAMYYAWKAIVEYRDGVAQVNLLLNRASPWVDIDSYLPYEGKVVIRNKTAHSLAVRLPLWVRKQNTQCLLNATTVNPVWQGQYLTIESLTPGDVVTITFPIEQTTERYTLKWKERDFWMESTNPGSQWIPDASVQYTLTFKGNTLVDIAPRSSRLGYALYQRTQERDGTIAPMTTVTRFVSERLPD